MSEIITVPHSLYEERDEPGYPPLEYRTYLECPFVKHNGFRYERVNNSCTQRWGFRSIGQLNEHIQRVHSLQFGCTTCKKRFTQGNKAKIEQTKLEHQCIPRPWTCEDPEWLSEEQESRLANWNEQGHAQESSAEKWKRIYSCIFPDDENVPGPCYDFLIPYYFASPPRLVTQGPTLHHHDKDKLSKVIDPSLIHESRNKSPDTTHSRALKAPDKPQLEHDALEKNEAQFDYGFDFSVSRGTDSGYYSGKHVPEPQTPDLSLFVNDTLPSVFRSSPEPDVQENRNGSLFGIGGGFSSNLSEVEPEAELDGDYFNDETGDGVANEQLSARGQFST